MVKGLVLYDYDGTLVDERDEIYVPTQLTKVAISRLQDLGYLCVLATGRALSYIPNGAKDLHLDGYVTSNGAHVTVHGKVIHNDVFPMRNCCLCFSIWIAYLSIIYWRERNSVM